MATAEELLAIAKKELGTKESPANSNKVKYASWYGLNGQPWCVMFVQWVFAQAGVSLPARTASCTALMNAAKSAGSWVSKDFLPGDVVIYDWGADGVPDHCGIVETATSATVVAIEGNTAVGNDSDGGEVMRRTRVTSQILGAVRPTYEKEEPVMDNTPAAAHKEGVNWCKEKGILRGDANRDLRLSDNVTRQELCTMLYRMSQL